MNRSTSALALAAMLVLGSAVSTVAWAGGGQGRVSVAVGASWGTGWGSGWGGGRWGPGWGPRFGPGWGPGWRAGWWGPGWGWSPVWGPGVVVAPTVVWPAPAVAVPQTIVVPAAPATVYIERDEPVAAAPPAQQQSGQWWYFCQSSRAFYPYVRECAEGWQRVPPTPPS